MDIGNPYAEEVKKAPGSDHARVASEVAHFVHYIGGPKLNEDALATLISDLYAWLKP